MRTLPLLAALAAALALQAACTTPRRKPPASPDAPTTVHAGPAAGAEGTLETGRLVAAEQTLPGPFVLTYLAPGAELQVVSAAGKGAVLGSIVGPLELPFHVPAGAYLRLPGAGDALYAGHRPMPITKALEAWIGRQIQVGFAAGQPEPWVLRGIGSDHVTLERSRTYRVVPTRRISEIVWTDLTGIDPTPRMILAPE